MDLIKLFTDSDFNIQIFINKWLIIVIILFAIILFLCLKIFKKPWVKAYEFDEATIGIGNQKIKIKPNYEDMQTAYKLWVELSTRKIGLPIDFNNDVIVEIFNSWYEFFRLTRELIKEIPIVKVRKNKSTKEIVRISIEVLNEGLRPHLTKWQAKFRKWYESKLTMKENEKLSPQQLQRKFDHYNDLIKEMEEVNQRLVKYREILSDLSIGDKNR